MGSLAHARKVAGDVIERIENSKAPFIYFIITFLLMANLRTFLEVFSDKINVSFDYILHYNLFYIAVALSFMLLFHFLMRIDIIKIARIMLPSFAVLFIAPIFDLAVTAGKGFDMTYLLPGVHGNLLLRFFTFFGDFPGMGITPGIRIGVAFGIIGSFLYVYIKQAKVLKAIVAALLTYSLLFIYGITPFIAKFILMVFGVEYSWSDILLSSLFLTVILVQGLFIAYLVKKDYFNIIIRDLRSLRVMAFVLLFFLGVVVGLPEFFVREGLPFKVISTNFFHFLFMPLSIIFGILFLIIINNLADYEIDKISNNGRPLFDSRINHDSYARLGWYFLILSFVFALLVSFSAFFILALFIGVYFIYSVPPLRLKRVLFLSKLMIGAGALLMVMLGFIVITGGLNSFPGILIVSFLVGATLVGNMIDIKDYEGDKKAGIKTLPVLMGLKKSKVLIGFLILITYAGVGLLQKDFFVRAGFIFLGILIFYLINKKKYDEKLVMLVFLISIIVMMISISPMQLSFLTCGFCN
ncbi:UbiA family prenyltransferase [Candidatus Woesearchaeota archaeon]|nr:UbiA family prenyltransferase [Candidatus Woesearchaeota archaeon]